MCSYQLIKRWHLQDFYSRHKGWLASLLQFNEDAYQLKNVPDLLDSETMWIRLKNDLCLLTETTRLLCST